ncbi:hypothetical protein ACHAWF_017089 [Thalassiosira exigua]
MLCNVKLLPEGDDRLQPQRKGKGLGCHSTRGGGGGGGGDDDPTDAVSNLFSDTRMDVHLAYVRRLRDACVTGADLDVQVHDISINLDVTSGEGRPSSPSSVAGCDVGAFVHMMIGLLHCYYKDRSFVDPLLPVGVKKVVDGERLLLRGFDGESPKEAASEVVEEEAGPDGFLPEVALMDDDLDSSDESDYEEEPDEEHDQAYLAWKKEQEEKEGDVGRDMSVKAEGSEDSGLTPGEAGANEVSTEPLLEQSEGVVPTQEVKEKGEAPAKPKSYKRKRKAVIVVASGAQKFEKLSFSLSIPRINMKLCLPKESEKDSHSVGDDKADPDAIYHCLELLLEGFVVESIWPKNRMGDMGGHVQGSIRYFHLLESAYRKYWGAKMGTVGPQPWNVVKISPLLRVGTRLFRGHDAFSLSPRVRSEDDAPIGSSKCDEFPLMESRRTTWSWDRQSNCPRAAAFKSTISFVNETLTRWSKTNVQHEASLGELEVVLNAAPFERMTKIFSDPRDDQTLWFDERWLSGHWHQEISSEMIAIDNIDLCLKEHLQPLPSLYPASSSGKQSPLSSELRSVTAHFDSITVKLPNPTDDISSFRMADVIFSISEATLLVSNDLPSSFLSGVVAAENTLHDFPHDPSDISCTTAVVSDEQMTTFRLQMSVTGCGLRVMPVHSYALRQDDCGFCDLIAPTNVTMILSLEHKDSQESPDQQLEANQTIACTLQQSLILSLLVHQIASNIELRSLSGALETLKYHAEKILKEEPPSGDVDKSKTVESKPIGEGIAAGCNAFSTICIHVPDVELNLWGEPSPRDHSTEVCGVTSSKTEPNHTLLCRVKGSQFEFGMEFSTKEAQKGSVYKCGLSAMSAEIACSRGVGGDGAVLEMVKVVSMESKNSNGSNLVRRAFEFCFSDVGAVSEKGFLLRSESEASISASAVEISSPLVVDLDTGAIEFFLNLVVKCLLAPVFIGSKIGSNEIISQMPLGSAMWSAGLKLYDLFSSPPAEPGDTETIGEGGNTLFRICLDRLLVLVPPPDGSETSGTFGLIFGDIDIAVGESPTNFYAGDTASASRDNSRGQGCHRVVKKHCGRGQTWLKEFDFLGKGTSENNTFYVLRSKQSMLDVGCPIQALNGSHTFKSLVPELTINWSLPEGVGGCSAPPFDLFAVTDLGMTFMNMGMPLSSVYFKLYNLSPKNESEQSKFTAAATRLHNSIGSYHNSIHNIIDRMNAEMDKMKNALFSKEYERIGALALASSTASGWVRVGEDLPFTHRIFSSATFWRYWMVLNRTLLILYKAPGTKPSFVIPLQASTQLRVLSMASSSNKAPSSIVGNHFHQMGFSLFDSSEGTELHFVACPSDHDMWVRKISMALKREEAASPDIASSSNAHSDATGQSSTLVPTDDVTSSAPSLQDPNTHGASQVIDLSVPLAASSAAQDVGPFGAFNEVQPEIQHMDLSSATDANIQSAEPNASSEDPFDVFGVAAPAQKSKSTTPDESLDLFDVMEDVDMEAMDDVSLGDSPEKIQKTLPTPDTMLPAHLPSHEQTHSPPASQPPNPPSNRPTLSMPEPQTNALQNVNLQSLPMRERLALAKGKSKMASSRFGSALKTAKGGMLAASEMSRDGIKQAIAKEAPAREELTKRSLAVGQKMSMLKKTANTKLAARSTTQDQTSGGVEAAAETSVKVPALHSNAFQDEITDRKAAVGQKMAMLKKNLSTAVRPSTQEELMKRVDTNDSIGPSETPSTSSQHEPHANRSGKQELRKKFANLDQTMSNTMRRLKIDEKVTQLSAAVKSGVRNDPVVRKLSSEGRSHSMRSDHSKRQLGIGRDMKSMKPINFSARETFSASSDLPLKVKSTIASGCVLAIDYDAIESLQRIKGNWVVTVNAVKASLANPSFSPSPNGVPGDISEELDSVSEQVDWEWKYRISTTDIDGGTCNREVSVDRTLSEVLAFHAGMSELMSTHHTMYDEIVSREGFAPADALCPSFKKLSALEQLRVSGTLLKRVMESDTLLADSCSSLRDYHCNMMKAFVSIVLQCHMPEEAVAATKVFLKIEELHSEAVGNHGTYLTNGTHSAKGAFDRLSSDVALGKEAALQANALDSDPKHDGAHSSLLNVIMDGYTQALKDRDEAIASLATSNIINDSPVMQRQRAAKAKGSKASSSDEEMLNLCKQLGNEISSRTTAEAEVNRLNERLEFERKIAEAKERELQAELAKYRKASPTGSNV